MDERVDGITPVTGIDEPAWTCGELIRAIGGGGEATLDNEVTQDTSESSLVNLNDIGTFHEPISVSWISATCKTKMYLHVT